MQRTKYQDRFTGIPAQYGVSVVLAFPSFPPRTKLQIMIIKPKTNSIPPNTNAAIAWFLETCFPDIFLCFSVEIYAE